MSKQMVVIAVVGLKGGVGKTTTATNVAYLLANEHKKRVLLADADCQGNASTVFGMDDSGLEGMAELMSAALENEADTWDIHDFIYESAYGVDIIPADGYLLEVNGKIIAQEEHNQVHILSNYLQQCRGEYDFCIIDCGLQLDMTVSNAILASDFVITPVRAGGFELSALDNLLTQIEYLRDMKSDIEVVSLFTMFQNNKVHRDLEEWFHNQKQIDMFENHIRNSVVVTRNSLNGGPLAYRSKNSNPVKDYRSVVNELLKRLEVV